MVKIRVTKEFGFESSHALQGYDGLCRNIHGHSYRLLVTISGTPVNEPQNPKNGMVMDFGDLKKIVREEIVNVYDHCIIINEDSLPEQKEGLKKITERIICAPYQPTCENMVFDFATKIKNKLPENVRLERVVLYETPSSNAEWLCSDNEDDENQV